MRTRLPRDFFIPKTATKVRDKTSDAVAYLYTAGNGKPAAMVFFGKQTKPVLRYYYADAARREKAVRDAFDSRRARLAGKIAEREKRKAWSPPFAVGDIFKTCWGYEQTNVEYFELVELRGKHGILREIAQERTEDGWARGKCVPLPGQYVGEPQRRLAQERGFRIDRSRFASLVPSKLVAGVRVIEPAHWTAYH